MRDAESELSAAKLLFESSGAFSRMVCFHCQQNAEKALKSLMVLDGIEPDRTHDLDLLRKRGAASAPSLKGISEAAIRLNAHAVQTRYPDTPPPTRAQCQRSLSDAEDIISAVKAVAE
jgi:HEPN domain-containing protein